MFSAKLIKVEFFKSYFSLLFLKNIAIRYVCMAGALVACLGMILASFGQRKIQIGK